jgi:hypothetical protein
MATAAATMLDDCGGGSSNVDGCRNSGGKDDGNDGNGVGDDHPCLPCHAHFVTRHVVANAIVHVVAIAITFASVR